jgi:chemotaxis protein methyltransferase CheR
MGFSRETLRLSDAEFKILRDLIRERTGIHYEIDRRDILADKLSSRAVERGFETFIDYYYLLKYGPEAEDEWGHVLDALSVPETYFWREMDHVRALVDVVLPQIVAAGAPSPLRIWSAACATGEEPLTLAIALDEARWFDRLPIEILASDGSVRNIEKARLGVYRERSFRSLPPEIRDKHFRPAGGGWRAAPQLHDRIRWSVANLAVSADIARMMPASVIFCRNVFIYFSADAIAQTVRAFSEGMKKPAYLFVGVSESLIRHTSDFELREIAGTFVYCRR